jgi:hypothetical protein
MWLDLLFVICAMINMQLSKKAIAQSIVAEARLGVFAVLHLSMHARMVPRPACMPTPPPFLPRFYA